MEQQVEFILQTFNGKAYTEEARGPRGGGPAAAGRPGGGEPQINLEREKLNLTESLAFMVEQLGVDHAITKRILGGATPAARAAELVDKTRLTDPEIRNLLRAGGRGAVRGGEGPGHHATRHASSCRGSSRASTSRRASQVQDAARTLVALSLYGAARRGWPGQARP